LRMRGDGILYGYQGVQVRHSAYTKGISLGMEFGILGFEVVTGLNCVLVRIA
jgi:hypothetical protein